jgi:ribosomal protein L11 methyltransferase
MPNSSWLEISLIVDGELAEAVAEVLSRFVSGGVAIESTAVTASADDSQGHAIGPLRVCGYLPANAQLEENRRRLEEALWYLGRIRPLPAPQFRTVQEQDWAQAWKSHYHPIAIGRRLMVVPAWEMPPNPERIALRMDPGMAFGTGTHPTTQLCLEFIDLLYDEGQMTNDEREEKSVHRSSFVLRAPASVIDVGCGSGILAIAALKLGAQRALAVDIDPLAVEAAQSNATLNGVAEQLQAGLGSVAEIRRGDFALQTAPLILVNILAPVIVGLLDDGLVELVSPGGALVLSGILQEQANEVEAALRQHGLQVSVRRQSGDWIALMADRP